MTKRYCTIPDILNCREWWEKFFGMLCKAHDEAYVATLNVFVKLWADAVMIFGMSVITFKLLRDKQWRDGFGGIFWTVGATLVLPTIGTVYWVWQRTLERSTKLQKSVEWLGEIINKIKNYFKG